MYQASNLALAADAKSRAAEEPVTPLIFHTYLQNFQPAKTCDIPNKIGSDERGECEINLSC